ncbi:MAG: hypothetical protein Q7R93_02505 [bacterium]|nr:hypothetical protein [bacterium]
MNLYTSPMIVFDVLAVTIFVWWFLGKGNLPRILETFYIFAINATVGYIALHYLPPTLGFFSILMVFMEGVGGLILLDCGVYATLGADENLKGATC